MINKGISKFFYEQTHSIKSIHDEMAKEAIEDDGIWSTFKFYNHWLPAQGVTKAKLRYYKLDCDDKWLPAQRNIFYMDCPELGDVTLPYLCAEVQQKVAERIKMDMVKKDNAIWSTIKVQPCHDHFDVSYEKAYVDNDNMTIKWKPEFDEYVAADIKATKEAFKAIPRYLRSDCMVVNSGETLQGLEPKEQKSSFASEKPMTAQEMEIENTKRALRRLRENSYYGLYPRNSGKTYAFDEMSKQSLNKTLEIWKAKADLDIHSPSKEFLNRVYGSHNKEEKEKKDMNITLMVVPEGMSETFVRKVKANYQSNNSLRLFIASTDIDYSCEHEPIKTKYDLFEKWIKTGYVDIVYFMLGFEKDPDAKAFESFVRGITEFSGKVDVRVAYQRDDILNDANNLRTAYFDEADAKEDLENAGNKVVKEAKTMQDIYGLDDEGLEDIKNSTGRIDASEGLIMDKIMEAAFASDEDAKPAKKGGKK